MRFQKINIKKLSVTLFILLTFALSALAQDVEKSTIVYGDQNNNLPIATGNNLYCAGLIQKADVNTGLEIVGANNEKDKNIYAQGDELYISSGAANGVKVGDMFSVIRPRGKVKSEWTKKKNIGFYVEEVGAVEVIRVMRDVSVARVKTSCSTILLGDLVQRTPVRTSPLFKKRAALDIYAAASGKAKGRILMARDGQELLAREFIVYIDLGREDNIQVGDYLTIFRPLGTGNIYTKEPEESTDSRKEGFESDRYKGGGFSNQAGRKKGSQANGDVVTTEGAKKGRPSLRKVLGEMVILNVSEKTATAVIVRNASEIHTGDYVEIQ